MSAIGRNDPCPCGSGKKFKRCCLGKDGPPPGAWTSGERDSALASLMRFAGRGEFDGDRAAAQLTFWGKRLDRMTPAEAREALDFEQSLLADCPTGLDVLFVPGGLEDSTTLMDDQEVLEFLADRGKTARYVSSVCTGALVLGAAGLLRGDKATGHWYIRDLLSLLGATPDAGLPEVAPKAVHERLMRARSAAISVAREKARMIGARLGA